MTAPVITVKNIEFFERAVHLRLPFKFGVVTLREAVQLYVRVDIEDIHGNRAQGVTAELMVPKWFDKNKDLSNDDNVAQLRKAVGFAREAALEDAGTAFDIHLYVENKTREKCAAARLNNLIASFGVAQIDKAILDALCRLQRVSFFKALQANMAGMPRGDFFANCTPLKKVQARHTVGLLDPLQQGDIEEPVQDGLPQSLEDIAKVYGHRYFKIKVNGDLDRDITRLENIASVLDGLPWAYHITLDGNEQYASADDFAKLLTQIEKSTCLEKFRSSILYIEQPVHRVKALDVDMSFLAQKYPVILDESDDSDDIFMRGKALGYTGISSKACKGVYRSLQNAILARDWNAQDGSNKYFLSAEDLTTQAGLGVQQDLALIALLGLTHVERNGHHYVDGMTASVEEAQNFVRAHPDLYTFADGKCRLKILNGDIDLSTLDAVGFASGTLPLFETQIHPERKVI